MEIDPYETWQVEPDAADDVAYAALADDRVWNAFAIADLEPPFRAFSRIAVARRQGIDSGAACLLFRSPEFNVVVPHGNPAGVAVILATVELPASAGAMVQSEHLAALDRWYDFPRGRRLMVRMAVDAARFRPAPPVTGLVRLDPTDLGHLLDLYTAYPENHFAPIQLEHGVYFGVREAGRLVAVGGTHVVAPRYGVAALGGIFTLPEARRRGYAAAVTSAVVSDLLDRGCRDVVLTVHADNEAARRVYARLGFRDHYRYETGNGVLRGRTGTG
jgi:RimJ/RimL family protein N-acetyltransferase